MLVVLTETYFNKVNNPFYITTSCAYNTNISSTPPTICHEVAQLVDALRYKPEGRRFD